MLATVDNGDSEKIVSEAVHWGIQCALLTDERDTCFVRELYSVLCCNGWKGLDGWKVKKEREDMLRGVNA